MWGEPVDLSKFKYYITCDACGLTTEADEELKEDYMCPRGWFAISFFSGKKIENKHACSAHCLGVFAANRFTDKPSESKMDTWEDMLETEG